MSGCGLGIWTQSRNVSSSRERFMGVMLTPPRMVEKNERRPLPRRHRRRPQPVRLYHIPKRTPHARVQTILSHLYIEPGMIQRPVHLHCRTIDDDHAPSMSTAPLASRPSPAASNARRPPLRNRCPSPPLDSSPCICYRYCSDAFSVENDSPVKVTRLADPDARFEALASGLRRHN